MRKHFGKRRIVPVAIAFLALALLSGVAYAYWTSGGSGSGSGTAATGNTTLTVHQTSVLTAMYPGDTAQTLSGNFDNPNSVGVQVVSVTVSIASVTKGGVPATGCDSTDFTLTNPTATVGALIPPGYNQGSWGLAGPTTIQFNNKATNQDACKGVTVNFAFSIP